MLSLPKLIKWIMHTKILRVNELVVASIFEQGTLSLQVGTCRLTASTPAIESALAFSA